MDNKYKASVIISIYKNIEALRCVLDSLKLQSEQSFEIIISEDAQHAEVAEFCATYPFEHDFQHLTQPDCGWQKNRALNRAIVSAKADYLIFVDGDCPLHPRFVESHLSLSRGKGDKGDKVVVAGKRVKLNDELSALMLEGVENHKEVERQLRGMLLGGDKRGNKFIEEGIFVEPTSLLGRLLAAFRGMKNLKGCNMSFSKGAIYAINGFDEDYTLPAIGEDIDLVWRFEAAGYRLVSARNRAVQYHLNHKENWCDQSENVAKMLQKQSTNSYICRNGIEKL